MRGYGGRRRLLRLQFHLHRLPTRCQVDQQLRISIAR
jgi:hypothetical protein